MLYYMYGITSAENPLTSAPLSTTFRVVRAGLAAVIEPVSEAEFSPGALERHLESIDWVARTARRHQAVLSAAMEGGAVLPARLCTLFSQREAVARYLEDDEVRFASTLERLSGRSEWGLKIFCDEGRLGAMLAARDEEIQSLDAQAATASPGKAYLLQKKRDARLEVLRREHIDTAMFEVEDDLATLQVAISHKAFLPAEMTGRPEPMVMNLAVLVGHEELIAYHASVQVFASALSTQGFLVESSGPWPAYSFCDEAAEDDMGDDDDHEPATQLAQAES